MTYKKDAIRYRYLRNPKERMNVPIMVMEMIEWQYGVKAMGPVCGDELDALVDAETDKDNKE